MLKAQLGDRDKYKRTSLATYIDDLLQREIKEAAGPSLAQIRVLEGSWKARWMGTLPVLGNVCRAANATVTTAPVHALSVCLFVPSASLYPCCESSLRARCVICSDHFGACVLLRLLPFAWEAVVSIPWSVFHGIHKLLLHVG